MTIDLPQTSDRVVRTSRIRSIDIARGVALIAMAIYHFAWDLEFFGYAAPGLTAVGGWKIFARSIATSFLFLVGVSLVLAHAKGVRWNGFARRWAMVAVAALAISVVTYLVMPQGFIFFGILHQIALASVLGLAFLRVPPILTLILAAAVVAAPFYLQSAFFDHPALWWVGLSTINPRSNDYVPLFPWFGAVLAGIAAARIARSAGLFAWLGTITPDRWSVPLQFSGRHGLAFYLIHQPVLIACVGLFALAFPPAAADPESMFGQSCERQCAESRDAAFCTRYCSCMLDTLTRDGLIDNVLAGDTSQELQRKVEDRAFACTADSDQTLSGGSDDE